MAFRIKHKKSYFFLGSPLFIQLFHNKSRQFNKLHLKKKKIVSVNKSLILFLLFIYILNI